MESALIFYPICWPGKRYKTVATATESLPAVLALVPVLTYTPAVTLKTCKGKGS